MQRLTSWLILLLLGMLLFVGYFKSITAYTQDLGRHLLMGNIILETGSIPTTNLLSYTYPNFAFLNHHYGSETLFYLIHQLGGDFLLLLTTTLIMLTVGALLFITVKKEAIAIPLGIVSFLLINVLFERTDIRPEIFSFLLTAIFVTVLYSYRSSPSKLVLLLIPLTLVWVQLHIYFFVGLILIALFLLDGLITYRKRLDAKYTSILVVVFIGSMLSSFINPNGIAGAFYPLRVFENYGYTIEENQTVFLLESLGFVKLPVQYFKASVALLFLTLLLTLKRTRPVDWLLAITFTIAGFLAVRNLPLFAIAVFIPFVRSASMLYKPLRAKLSPKIVQAASLLLVVILLWQILVTTTSESFGFSVMPGARDAVTFFQENDLKGPLFNNFDIGSYLAYRLYPNEKVFVDGRPEAYPAVFFQETYIPMQENQERFTAVANEYQFNTIFISHTDQTPWAETFLASIIKNPDWIPIYLDPTVIILVEKNEVNQALIDEFGMTDETLVFSHYDSTDTQLVQQTAHFATIIQNTRLTKHVLYDLLKLEPDNCAGLYNLTNILLTENNQAATIYQARYLQFCT